MQSACTVIASVQCAMETKGTMLEQFAFHPGPNKYTVYVGGGWRSVQTYGPRSLGSYSVQGQPCRKPCRSRKAVFFHCWWLRCGSQVLGRGRRAAVCGVRQEVTRKASLLDGISNVVVDPVFTVPFHFLCYHALTALPISYI